MLHIEEDSAGGARGANHPIPPLATKYGYADQSGTPAYVNMCFWLNNQDFSRGHGTIMERTAYIHWLLGGCSTMNNCINAIAAEKLSCACPFAALRAYDISGAHF